MEKHWITRSGFVLEEGKTYKWSGLSDDLYTALRWTDNPFKVVKAKRNGAKIYDVYDNQMIDLDEGLISQNSITFKV